MKISQGRYYRYFLFGFTLFVIVGVYFGKFSRDTSTSDVLSKFDENSVFLPLGDGGISKKPEVGKIYKCRKRFFDMSSVGSDKSGPWIDEKNNVWYPDQKIHVQGANSQTGAYRNMTIIGTQREIKGNRLPDHMTGNFPISTGDPAYIYDRNPNTISSSPIVLSLPLYPSEESEAQCIHTGIVGIFLNGVPLYDGLDEKNNDAPAHEIQDLCDGHPEQSGIYHYHNLSRCIKDSKENTPTQHSELLGYALDGFGIYGKFGESGKELFTKDLDVCHGHKHMIDSKEAYHYHMTRDFPYSLGCFK